MSEYGDAPPEFVSRLRPLCLALPEAYEHDAWAGVRWRIRQHSFAHVLSVSPQHPASRSLPAGERANLLIFRAAEDELEALTHAGPPFFATPWGHNVITLRLDQETDWTEVAELITDSYCVQAPAKLVAKITGPAGPRASSSG